MHRQINPDELDDLYYLIGKCIRYVQYVEDALHTLLTLKVEIKVPGVVASLHSCPSSSTRRAVC